MDIIFASSVLKIAPPFTAPQLLSAYRKEAIFRHPDRGGSDDLFRELTAAYDFMKPLAQADTFSEGPPETIGGVPLSELGKGYPLTKNACTCDQCAGKGYTEDESFREATCGCVKCKGHGIISYDCKKCAGAGKTKAGTCYSCRGSGRFFPRVSPEDIENEYAMDQKGRRVTIQASKKIKNLFGKICFECEGTGRIPWDVSIFARMWEFYERRRSRITGSLLAQMMVKDGIPLSKAKEILDFKGEGRQVFYHRCSKCKGIGEIEMFNPVLPRGLIAQGR